jgi:hypothetical protein
MKSEVQTPRIPVAEQMQAIEAAEADMRRERHNALEFIGVAAEFDRPRRLRVHMKRLQILKEPAQCTLRIEHGARGLREVLGTSPGPLTKAKARGEKGGQERKQRKTDEKLDQGEAGLPC